ncbi:acyltransferase family protein [Dawidia soli]|uniref:Acyltransferase family protein n=1 Tax=Dawidia soli TaxID=2782352 RepID=A0AAP2D5Z7_9BACT|nr:acyltransferase family protein [Dawidia soli]MBT1685981.1 acyltransferase family protein [Dawidia soli]
MLPNSRRYDIDWIRVIAIGLLLIYHVAIAFQPWGIMLAFITSTTPWPELWLPMGMLNIWRIPLLFFVSGMGVYFALQNRTAGQLLLERTRRILVPFLTGIALIVPAHIYLWQRYNGFTQSYSPNPGHLWFLGNIFIYIVVLLPVVYNLQRHETGRIAGALRRLFSTPIGLLAMTGAFILEARLTDAHPYELYALTWHGFFLGMLAFFFGFCFVLSGEPFWKMLLRWRWAFLAIAITLFIVRLMVFNMQAPAYLLVPESHGWILSVFAFGHKYLNRPGNGLRYLSEVAYPIYILHMIFLSLGSFVIFPLGVPAPVQFVLLVLFTVAGCFAFYEGVVRRVGFVRPLFGLKYRNERRVTAERTLHNETPAVQKD